MDAPNTVNTRIRLPKDLFDAVIEHSGSRGMAKFFRDAAAEKLSRDFCVLVSPTMPREGQGKRNDLKDNPERLEALKEQAAKMRERRWKKE